VAQHKSSLDQTEDISYTSKKKNEKDQAKGMILNVSEDLS
jgi:hypothetical protein